MASHHPVSIHCHPLCGIVGFITLCFFSTLEYDYHSFPSFPYSSTHTHVATIVVPLSVHIAMLGVMMFLMGVVLGGLDNGIVIRSGVYVIVYYEYMCANYIQ